MRSLSTWKTDEIYFRRRVRRILKSLISLKAALSRIPNIERRIAISSFSGPSSAHVCMPSFLPFRLTFSVSQTRSLVALYGAVVTYWLLLDVLHRNDTVTVSTPSEFSQDLGIWGSTWDLEILPSYPCSLLYLHSSN